MVLLIGDSSPVGKLVSVVISCSCCLSTSASGSTSSDTTCPQAPLPGTHTEVSVGKCQEEGSPPTAQDQTLSSTDLSLQMKEKETTSEPESSPDSETVRTSSTPPVQASAPSVPQQSQSHLESSSVEPKELHEGQEIYIQTEGLAVQMSEPGMDRIVIVNGPDGTTMHIQTPEDVPLEAVHALLGIEASNEDKASQ